MQEDELRLDLSKVDVSSVQIIDEKQLGPLPDQAIKYFAALGATEIKISVRDGRSWILTGINVFRGEKRVFVARVFNNGYVRGYLAPPPDKIEDLISDLRAFARKVLEEKVGKDAGEA